MPSTNCKNCNKTIRNPPSRKITGFCSRCLGVAHKVIGTIYLDQLKLDKINLTEKILK
jgi:hypothetical protein